MKKAIAFITTYPKNETIAFAEEIAFKTQFDVFIFSDTLYSRNSNELGETITSLYPNLKIISFTDDFVVMEGFTGSMIPKSTTIQKNPISWDKMMYYFAKFNTSYESVWIFEDDVFIPSVDVLLNLDKKYEGYDLVTPNNFKKTDNLKDWHWQHIFDKIEPPYYYSMVCACKVSNNLFKVISEYVKKHNRIFFIEVIFNTLAMQNNLNVTDAFELKSVVWQGEWGMDEFILLPNNVFHPKKNIDDYHYLRTTINYNKKNNFKPINKLPNFIKDLL